jgi:uncharacterized protein with PQ loop repeat
MKNCTAKYHVEEEVTLATEDTPLLRSNSATLLAAIIPAVLGWQHNQGSTGLYLINTTVVAQFDFWYEFGRSVAWVCSALYLSSRIPQIYRNFERQTCEGLAMIMFMCAFLGNVTYAASILVKANGDINYILGALPYLLGSGGTVIFDFIIFMQYLWYQRVEPK